MQRNKKGTKRLYPSKETLGKVPHGGWGYASTIHGNSHHPSTAHRFQHLQPNYKPTSHQRKANNMPESTDPISQAGRQQEYPGPNLRKTNPNPPLLDQPRTMNLRARLTPGHQQRIADLLKPRLTRGEWPRNLGSKSTVPHRESSRSGQREGESKEIASAREELVPARCLLSRRGARGRGEFGGDCTARERGGCDFLVCVSSRRRRVAIDSNVQSLGEGEAAGGSDARDPRVRCLYFGLDGCWLVVKKTYSIYSD